MKKINQVEYFAEFHVCIDKPSFDSDWYYSYSKTTIGDFTFRATLDLCEKLKFKKNVYHI